MKKAFALATIVGVLILGSHKPLARAQGDDTAAAPAIGDVVLYVMPDGTPRPAMIVFASQDQKCILTVFIRREDDPIQRPPQPPITGPSLIPAAAVEVRLFQLEDVARDDFRSPGTWHFANLDDQAAQRKGPRPCVPLPRGCLLNARGSEFG